MKPFSLLLCVLGLVTTLSAQDPAFSHFYTSEAIFNPAYVGYSGATTISIRGRTQWQTQTATEFFTRQVMYEESLPCAPIDYGFSWLTDIEGEGALRTTELSPKIAFTLPLAGKRSLYSDLNIRVGAEFKIGRRNINFDDLIFLDQLDPLYGLVDRNGNANPTGFVPGSGEESRWYTSPTLGLLITGVTEDKNREPWSYEIGAAIHNWDYFVSADSRQSASLNGLNNPLGERLVLSARVERTLYQKNGNYFSVRPQIVYQNQVGLSYLEVGSSFLLSRSFTAGMYYHAAGASELGTNSNWVSLQLEIGGVVTSNTRVDFGFAFSLPAGGL
ncbi:MAG: PorP/SprF family type IX secretion system membrane protein, partial [Bacteroidota bacterium]